MEILEIVGHVQHVLRSKNGAHLEKRPKYVSDYSMMNN